MRIRTLFHGIVAFACRRANHLLAQQSGDPSFREKSPIPRRRRTRTTTISLSAKLVSLPRPSSATKKGNLVHTLNKDDFCALGRQQGPSPIRYFDKDDDLPYTLGLLVDTSGSVRKHARR